MSVMKWTLPKNKKDLLKKTSRTQARSNQQRTKGALQS